MPDSDTSTEFIFGSLSTAAGRVRRVRTLRLGLQHDAVISPIDPRPDEPVQITVRAGVGAALKTATLCYTIDGTRPDPQLPSTNFIPMERTSVEWDTLIWAQIETWSA
ncbi:MAG: alpha-amylase, partial [Chloroflexi bacterium]|nr:alpha-amylase [Chloroflexota bacterium]